MSSHIYLANKQSILQNGNRSEKYPAPDLMESKPWTVPDGFGSDLKHE